VIFMEERGVLTLSETDWAKAKHRADVIRPLAELSTVGKTAAEEAAVQLGISPRLVYELIKRCRAGSNLVTDLASGHSSGGKGKTRIAPEVHTIITEVIQTMYLSRQKRSEELIVKEVRMRCRQAGYQMPAGNTIRARMHSLDPILVTQKRQGCEATRSLRSAAGKAPEPKGPLDIVQMDHTPIDLIVVEETSREPIGRPYLTLAIDTFTRCIVGMLVTFDAPSATSVGLCLAHTVMDKSSWLARLGIVDMTWAMHGKPVLIVMDNAPEFKSDALKRGCEQHGIKRDYRPGQQPHYGGIIERVIGTAMKMVHELPGTTFSNTQERGKYDSEANAVLTLRELEKWLTLAIGTYHESVHGSLWETPAAFWKRSIESSAVFTVKNEKAFLIDFLPVIWRNIGRTGFVIDHISYFADILKPWIARRDNMDKFIIRRDPRDLSRVWVLDPESKQYLEIPYRTFSNPSVTLWEHRKAVEKLRERGRAQVNEAAIFRMIALRREIVETAAKERKQARRDKARRSHLTEVPASVLEAPPDYLGASGEVSRVKPFDDIEEW
jgi:putative transposase